MSDLEWTEEDEAAEQAIIDAEGPDGTGDPPHPMGPWGKRPDEDLSTAKETEDG